MDERKEVLPGPLSRYERRLRRRKGTLLCDWCSRWTQVDGLGEMSLDTWRRFVERHPYFYCKRPNCLQHRSELMFDQDTYYYQQDVDQAIDVLPPG